VRLLASLLVLLAMGGCLDGIVGGGDAGPKEYASDRTYKTWVVEVDHSSGATPDGALLDFVKGRLNGMVRKEAIEFRADETLATDGGRAWSDADVQALAEQHQGLETGGSQAVTHLLFLTGHSASDNGDRKVLGVTYGHHLVAIFSDSVKAACTAPLPILGCDSAPYFRAVLVHEFGHVLGLVNNGAPMVHPHEAGTCGSAPDRGHSANRDSVMYCQVESSLAFTLFGSGGPPTDFDDNDRADIHALQ
jgi:hypothetical protein